MEQDGRHGAIGFRDDPDASAIPQFVGREHVLARHGRGMNAGQLRVFELKQPRAKDALDALGQSIHYAAALRCLLEPEDTRSLFLNVLQLGRTQPPIKITAVAFVHESTKAADLQDRIDHLNEENTGIALRAWRYRWDPNVAPPKRLLVVEELCPKP